MSILIRAIISGFGMKLGQDIYRVLNRKLGVFPEDGADSQEEEDDEELDDVRPVAFYALR